jgi:hypothetical protein
MYKVTKPDPMIIIESRTEDITFERAAPQILSYKIKCLKLEFKTE